MSHADLAMAASAQYVRTNIVSVGVQGHSPAHGQCEQPWRLWSLWRRDRGVSIACITGDISEPDPDWREQEAECLKEQMERGVAAACITGGLSESEPGQLKHDAELLRDASTPSVTFFDACPRRSCLKVMKATGGGQTGRE